MRKPVESSDDLLKALPIEVQEPQESPIRDDIVEAATAMFLEFQDRMDYAAGQSDPLRATDIYLDGIGKDHETYHHDIIESDSEYRSRIFDKERVVTPAAILEIANEHVAPYSNIEPQLAESILDAWYVHNNSPSVWDSFVGNNPTYLDRLYENDITTNDGYVRLQSEIGGTWSFNSDLGRWFVLRVPPLTIADSEFSFISSNEDHQSYISSNEDHTTYMFINDLTEAEVYALLVSHVSRIVGQGIRYELYIDPDL